MIIIILDSSQSHDGCLKFKIIINYTISLIQFSYNIINNSEVNNMSFQTSEHIESDFHTPKIQNVVGTFTLDNRQNLRLADLASKWSNSRYNKARFSGLVTWNTDPKATFMIFSNGKVIVTGARSEKQCQLSSIKLIKKMSKLGTLKSIKPRVNFKVQNVVATVSTKLTINLQAMHSKLSRQDCSFVPESFPGLIYKMKSPRATFLVFSTGKVVMTGVQNQANVIVCFRAFYRTLKKFSISKHLVARTVHTN